MEKENFEISSVRYKAASASGASSQTSKFMLPCDKSLKPFKEDLAVETFKAGRKVFYMQNIQEISWIACSVEIQGIVREFQLPWEPCVAS